MGALNGIREIIGAVPDKHVVHLDGRGTCKDSQRVTREFLRPLSAKKRVLIAAINDPAALGAVQALKEAGRTCATAVIVGQDATHEARVEMSRADSCLIGSVGFFPEKYGAQIIPLVLKILGGEAVPPTAHIEHALINRHNAARFYPAN